MRASIWSRQTPFVGRHAELSVLLDCLDAAANGHGRVVLVSGEPGAGKTRLLRELAARARVGGWMVLGGRAYEGDGLPPYLPFREALTAYARACSDAELRTLLGDQAGEIARLVPEVRRLAEPSPHLTLSAEDERYRLFESVSDVVLAVVRRGGAPGSGSEQQDAAPHGQPRRYPGLLLLLDDLQWADQPTLLLLLHLARRLEAASVLVAATYRDTDPPPGPALLDALATLRRERLDERVALTGLSLDDVEAVVAATSFDGIRTAGLAQELHNRTEGNPFFVEELLRGLGKTNRPDPAVPDGVRDVIARRLSGMSERCRHLLTCAAVIGQEVSPGLLEHVSGLDGDTVIAAAEEATGAGLLTEAGSAVGTTFAFRHDLVRQTVYGLTSAARRERLHARVASVIELLLAGDPAREPAVLAAHYRLAGAVADPGKALSAFVQAAEAAAGAFAWEQAVEQYQAALALAAANSAVADATRRCELLLALAAAQLPPDPAGSLQSYLEAAEIARSLPAPELLARAAIGYLGENPGLGAAPPQVVQLLEDALRLLSPDDSPLRARLLHTLSWALIRSGDPARRDHLSSEAVVVARRAGHASTLASALGERYLVLRGMLRDAEALAAVTEMARVAREGDDPWPVLWSHLFRAAISIDTGNLADADRDIDGVLSVAQRLRDTRWLVWAIFWRAERARMCGSLVQAERLIEQALETWRRRSQGRLTVLPLAEAMLRREQGRLNEMAGEFERLSEQIRAIPAPRIMTALIDLEAGRTAIARDRIESLDTDFPPLITAPETMVGVALRAEVCAGLDDRTRAAHLYDLLLPYDGSHISTWPWATYVGSVAGYLGMLARTMQRWDTAVRHFEDAIGLHDRTGTSLYLAHSRRELAVTLLQRPGRSRHALERARDLLSQALHAYSSFGTEFRASQVRELLADPRLAAGSTAGAAARPSRTADVPTYPDGLSQREVEVLRLVAAGKGNQEIADWLVISRFTVVRHINHILAKTGCANRTEATSYAHRHGLVE
jgi:DNA-binding CsgD family transcriptional regulator/tetratricopeptide (TPR) repeat protein